jgi:hypothetical protein
MSAIPYTADQLTGGIANAIKAREFEAVEHFLRLLVVVDPKRAEEVWDTLQLGILLGGDPAGIPAGGPQA